LTAVCSRDGIESNIRAASPLAAFTPPSVAQEKLSVKLLEDKVSIRNAFVLGNINENSGLFATLLATLRERVLKMYCKSALL
jgi:hypothetical protein